MTNYCMTGGDGQVHESDHFAGLHGDGRVCHSVVLIDPESDGESEAIVTAFVAAGVWEIIPAAVENSHHYRRVQVQAALRSLVTPPKPDEPQGLGAVVEDAAGDRWVHVCDCRGLNGMPNKDWQRRGEVRQSVYSDISAVRILSDGVTS